MSNFGYVQKKDISPCCPYQKLINQLIKPNCLSVQQNYTKQSKNLISRLNQKTNRKTRIMPNIAKKPSFEVVFKNQFLFAHDKFRN
jgi:hypothetical protein